MKYILYLLAMIVFFIFGALYGGHIAAKKTRKEMIIRNVYNSGLILGNMDTNNIDAAMRAIRTMAAISYMEAEDIGMEKELKDSVLLKECFDFVKKEHEMQEERLKRESDDQR